MKPRIERIAYALIIIALAIAIAFPASAAGPSVKKQIKNLKKWISKTFYTKAASDAAYYSKTSVDSSFGRYYDKNVSDTRYIKASGDTMTGLLTVPNLVATNGLNISSGGASVIGGINANGMGISSSGNISGVGTLLETSFMLQQPILYRDYPKELMDKF